MMDLIMKLQILLQIAVFVNTVIIIFNILDIIMNGDYKNNIFEIVVLGQLNFLIIDKCERDDI
jgi:hypothetical protein